ncbi:MAG TPA: serine/threonine-protein kinase [Polyangiales bacterium]|nr:serine/threonine-protein kinase [Polyangiales bacterium]
MRGVAAMHRAGVIHRDLKPENIFLCTGADGSPREPKVLDFGVSIVTSNTATGSTLSHGANTVIGTPAYMSPEQIENPSDVDVRADIYAFGAILYDAFTGQLPFSAESYPALLLAILRERPKHPSELRPDLPRELGEVLLRALSKRRDERYDSMDSFIAAVQPFGGIGETAVAPPVKAPRRTRFLIGALACLALLAAAGRTTTAKATPHDCATRSDIVRALAAMKPAKQGGSLHA